MAAVKCPRCGLFNPETAQRCDCGYDFGSGTIQQAYYKQELPRELRSYVIVIAVVNLIVGLLAVASGDVARIVVALAWSALVWWLYLQLVAKKNWARLGLVVVTFPIGLFLGLSREARFYCLQK